MNPLDVVAPRLTASMEPFTAPLSRLLVTREADGTLAVRVSAYETPLSEAALLTGLTLRDTRGAALKVERVRPDRMEFRSAAASAELTFADEECLALVCRGIADITWRPGAGAPGWDAPPSWVMHSPHGVTDLSSVPMIRIPHHRQDDAVVLLGRPKPSTPAKDLLARAEASWRTWFAAASTPRRGDHATYLHCWWALAANQVRLQHDPDRIAVAPSKVGYLGLWQWDAYFAAVGLRHGQPALAIDQLVLATRHQRPDGQLPDVVHDNGVLHSVEGLPESDLARLTEHVGQSSRSGTGTALVRNVPVTKPPLGAWALARVLQSNNAVAARWQVRELTSRFARGQQWWFVNSDPAGTGLPRYLHPYSSGIDDSPVWDHGTDAVTPDLGSYLALNADSLGKLAHHTGETRAAGAWKRESHALATRLIRQLWDEDRSCFVSRGASGPLQTRTALDLMPLLTGRLSGHHKAAICRDLIDPTSFGAPFPVPSVSISDPAFDAERMWRGPTWINMNYLLIEGLSRSGLTREADRLTEQTLRLVERSPTVAEYWNPLTGVPASSATAPFTWSAALYIDLAVRELSIGRQRDGSADDLRTRDVVVGKQFDC